ncbi:hypothetical protein [Burkholderia gladioli]|uniref:hypothetical protein n=1 Tax=Burkholderia gladioli TaxID=28095 RepID=UPI003F68A3F8
MTNPPARLTIYQQLLSELAELDKRIEQARARECVHAIETIHGLMDTYGIKHKDLVGRNGRRERLPSERVARSLSRPGHRARVVRPWKRAAMDSRARPHPISHRLTLYRHV